MTEPATFRSVTNGSGARVFIDGYGFLDADQQATVPDTPGVHELLGNGCLWTHEPASSDPDAPATADSAATTTTTRRGAKRTGKED